MKTQRIPEFLKKKPDRICIDPEERTVGSIKISKRIGSDSSYGEAYAGCYPANKCKSMIAVKKIPLTAEDYAYTSPLKSLKNLNASPIWAELYFSRLVSSLVEQSIVPHVPRYYTHYICGECIFENAKLTKFNKCIILPNDLAIGDLKYFLTKTNYTSSALKLAYTQIFLGILAINLYFKMDHNDLHYGNVLYKKVKEGVYRYNLDGKTYYIPNNGMLFYLWDFGFSTIENFIEPLQFRGSLKKGDDYRRITSMLTPGKEYDSKSVSGKINTKARNETYTFLSDFVNNPDKLQSVKDLLETQSVPYSPALVIVGRYNLDKSIKIRANPK